MITINNATININVTVSHDTQAGDEFEAHLRAAIHDIEEELSGKVGDALAEEANALTGEAGRAIVLAALVKATTAKAPKVWLLASTVREYADTVFGIDTVEEYLTQLHDRYLVETKTSAKGNVLYKLV